MGKRLLPPPPLLLLARKSPVGSSDSRAWKMHIKHV